MTTIQAPRPRPGLLDIDPYVGGEAKAVPHPQLGRPIRLASNEGAFGPSPQATAAYRELGGEIHRYPDGGCSALRQALAARFGLDAERIVAGAGSDELIALLAKSYAGPGDEVLYSRHGFLMYPIAAKAVGATPVAAPEADLQDRCRRAAGACDAAHPHPVPGQPEQPDRLPAAQGRGRAAARRPAAGRDPGARRRLCRIHRRPGLQRRR